MVGVVVMPCFVIYLSIPKGPEWTTYWVWTGWRDGLLGPGRNSWRSGEVHWIGFGPFAIASHRGGGILAE